MVRSFMHAAACAFLMLTMHAGAVHAASAPPAVLTVERVLSPAWIERANGRSEPLAVGMTIGNKEKIHTGDGGRALLRMAEGSAVKLGDGAMLAADDLDHRQDAKGGLVSASLDVVRGAFRFTTGLLAKSGAQRDVRVKVNTVTAGIRGTDVWGKSESDRDIVCLLEGRINVSHGAAQFTMQEPNSFYIAPRKGQAQPPSRVTPEQVKAWSAETEIDARTGAQRRGGTAAVTVASSGDERTATALRDKLRDSGFPAELERAAEGGAAGYHVRILSLADAADATVLAQRLQRQGYTQARAGR
jgi:hypothetical protein